MRHSLVLLIHLLSCSIDEASKLELPDRESVQRSDVSNHVAEPMHAVENNAREYLDKNDEPLRVIAIDHVGKNLYSNFYLCTLSTLCLTPAILSTDRHLQELVMRVLCLKKEAPLLPANIWQRRSHQRFGLSPTVLSRIYLRPGHFRAIRQSVLVRV